MVRHLLCCFPLIDIQGMEDALGDMDFKVAGTDKGITALQLDTKLPGLPLAWLAEALSLAREAHKSLLFVMGKEVELARQAAAKNGGGSLPSHKVGHL